MESRPTVCPRDFPFRYSIDVAVFQDPEDPGLEVCVGLELVKVAISAKVRFLNEIFGVRTVPRQVESTCVQIIHVLEGLLLE